MSTPISRCHSTHLHHAGTSFAQNIPQGIRHRYRASVSTTIAWLRGWRPPTAMLVSKREAVALWRCLRTMRIATRYLSWSLSRACRP